MRFLKEQLLLPFEGPNNVHCQCLEILYYMAQPKYIVKIILCSYRFRNILFLILFLKLQRKTIFFLLL